MDKKLGIDIKENIIAKLNDVSESCKYSHPEISTLLEDLALDLGMLSNRLINDDGSMVGECKVPVYTDEDTEEEIEAGCYRFFDASRIKLKNKD